MAAIKPIDFRKTRFGLLDSTASFDTSITSDIWRDGVLFDAYSCKTVNRWYHDSCDGRVVPPEDLVKAVNEGNRNGGSPFKPFPTYVFDGCNNADFGEKQKELQAKKLLDGGISAEFAKEIVTGEYSNSPSFTSVAIPINTTAAALDATIFAQLLRARAEANVVGAATFHVHEALAPIIYDLTIERPDGLYLINSNHRIIFDRYPQYTPTNGTLAEESATAFTDGTTYITVTGEVETQLGELYTNAGRKVRLNQQYARAEQQGIYAFDVCGVFAAIVNYPAIPVVPEEEPEE